MNGRRNAKIGVALLVTASLLIAYRLGVFRQLSNPSRFAQSLVDLGPWGYLAFIVAFTTLQPFGVPGTVFIVAAPLIWPWPIAFALSMTGSMTASLVGFSLARFMAGDAIAKKIPVAFQKYNDALETRAFKTVFVLRFIFWMNPFLHAFLGLSKVPFGTHFWGSLAGYLIPIFLVSFFGQKLFDWLKNAPPSVWIAFGILTLVVALGVFFWKRQRKSATSVANAFIEVGQASEASEVP